MKVNKRWWLWGPLLGASAWLALFADKAPSASEPVVRAPARGMPMQPAQVQATASTLIPRDQLIPGTGQAPARDLFAARSWTPPPPPAPPASPEVPTAPPLPFTFLGKKLEGHAWEIYLARGDQTFIAKPGTVIEGTYRIDSADPPNLVMTYLPLNQSQTLSIGDAK